MEVADVAGLSVRELITALCEVEDALRVARRSEMTPDEAGQVVDVAELVGREQRLVAELRRRRSRSGRH